MKASSRNPLTVRPMARADVPEVHAMLRELAEFENLIEMFEVSAADLERNFFGERPLAEALVAEAADGGLVGYAMFFPTYSSFLGRAGIWLEDLYVRPDWRGAGVGRDLLARVVGLARERDCGRCEWCVLDWNRRAIDFYRRSGGQILDEWRIVRLDRGAIDRLADGG